MNDDYIVLVYVNGYGKTNMEFKRYSSIPQMFRGLKLAQRRFTIIQKRLIINREIQNILNVVKTIPHPRCLSVRERVHKEQNT
jgi:hypothetical protein